KLSSWPKSRHHAGDGRLRDQDISSGNASWRSVRLRISICQQGGKRGPSHVQTGSGAAYIGAHFPRYHSKLAASRILLLWRLSYAGARAGDIEYGGKMRLRNFRQSCDKCLRAGRKVVASRRSFLLAIRHRNSKPKHRKEWSRSIRVASISRIPT